MIIPVRCISCGNPVGAFWDDYQNLLAEGKSIKEALDTIKFVRFCCRGVFMSHVESIDIVGKYK